MTSSRVETRLADVPAVLVPPDGDGPAPVVVCWHDFGSPADARSLARRLPLEGLHAWRLYPDLPFFGLRLAELGPRELARRQAEDYLVELLWPVVSGAASELPALLSALDDRLGGLRGGGTGLVGLSAGGTAALHALAGTAVQVGSAAVVGTPRDARSAVEAVERASGLSYRWTAAARRVAERLDPASLGERIAGREPAPHLLVVRGADDEIVPPSEGLELEEELRRAYGRRGAPEDRVQGERVPGLGHGAGPAAGEAVEGPARELDRRLAAWLRTRLGRRRS